SSRIESWFLALGAGFRQEKKVLTMIYSRRSIATVVVSPAGRVNVRSTAFRRLTASDLFGRFGSRFYSDRQMGQPRSGRDSRWNFNDSRKHHSKGPARQGGPAEAIHATTSPLFDDRAFCKPPADCRGCRHASDPWHAAPGRNARRTLETSDRGAC